MTTSPEIPAYLVDFLNQQLKNQSWSVLKTMGDCGNRVYFRLQTPHGTRIAVDSHADTKANANFLALANYYHQQGLFVPEILASDMEHGYLLMTDLGEHSHLTAVNADPGQLNQRYSNAIDALLQWQTIAPPPTPLTHFDARQLYSECKRTERWYIQQHLGVELSKAEKNLLAHTYQQLIRHATQQTQVVIHRDFHSDNLLCLSDNQAGIIDFQDALIGPVSYDIVSLLRDSRISLPPDKIQRYLISYHERAVSLDIPVPKDFNQFLQDFDWMGIQLHYKILGIFARMCHRDNKPEYLKHMPRILGYLNQAVSQYPELEPFGQLIATITHTGVMA